jgi:hypothetical protein
MRAPAIAGVATTAALICATPAAATITPDDFPSRAQVARILDLDTPSKIDVHRSGVDEYFGVVPPRCDITHHLGLGIENLQTAYWYATRTYVVAPSIEIRRYASAAEAIEHFRDVRRRLAKCAGKTYEDPPTAPTGGKVRLETYRAPSVGAASFGLTSSYCCEGGPAKSRIIVSRVGDTIVWTQGMNYGAPPVRMPSERPNVRLARLAVRRAQ